ncbi:hypothetical protein M408DRAFT_26593 [Serendipita vermifera MAFF 305830]|uniref:FHA domain-containing protein n=1 Tax=Serendipita vermifera MAFF 305830 TaxID=933852 RepID=A0A0C3AKB0_SERVB|nr:hypothetical protein M408DRAFT_26593 [Serendipita vermifera MAFF 305830]
MDDLPIGRYGTIHYMSNNGSEVPLASYPVDEPIINLGRSDHNSCHIRLFDRWCSDIHCKLIFDEGKALLVVLGDNGAIIDGSEFFPSSNEASPTTVPLTNGSEWLIYKRRFIFQYPPKDQRAKLLATPKKSRKSLRMSMINAAQLWTPSASGSGPKSQAESWRRLQSPVQPFPDGDGAAITVVEGDPVHLSHNQEEVIVVESVDSPEVPEPEVAPPASTRKTASTPSKRGPANLHKQVLLMNSHRKHTKSLDELEEREVEESILVEDNSDDDLEEDADANPFIEREVPIKAEEPEINLDEKSLTPRTFRASLGAIGSVLPFGRPSGVIHSPAPPGEGEEHEADQEMESPATEENTSVSVASRSRRGLRAESVTSDAPPAKATTSTSTHRGARTKAQAVAVALDSVEDEHSGSSASGVPEPVPVAKKGKRGQAAKVINEVAHEDDDEEADVSAAPAKPARRAARGKAAAAPSVEPAEMESEQASEDASVEVPKGKATAKKTSTRTKKTAAKKEDTSVEPEPAVPEKKPAARSTRKAVVKEEPEEDAIVETKPRRTARTKR